MGQDVTLLCVLCKLSRPAGLSNEVWLDLPKSIDRGAFYPHLYYMVAAMRDGREPRHRQTLPRCQRRRDGREEEPLQTVRTVFSIVGKQ